MEKDSGPKMTTIEKLQGVARLADVVKQLTTNVSQVSQTVGNMAQISLGQAQVNTTQVLCMPSMQLPSFRRDTVVHGDIS